VLIQDSVRYNGVYTAQDGSAQVSHYNSKGQYTYGSTTCTYTNNYTYANGEIRHDVLDLQCA
jgi:hypothetical protein